MTSLHTSMFAIGLILVLIAIRVPIGVSLGVVSFAGIASILGLQPALSLVGRLPYEFAASWEFSAIPMFLLMGAILFHSGLTESLFRAASLWLRWLPGGLAVATNMSCALFGAASGSSLATVVAMGRISIPQMRKAGYPGSFAAAVCACGGTVAALIPPSIPLIVYGILAEQSISRLFLAGVIPGLITAAAYTVMIIARCKFSGSLSIHQATAVSWRERWMVLLEIWPLPLLVVGVMGSIYSGMATPTEAGGFGALLALVIAMARRTLRWKNLRVSLSEAAKTTSAILFVATGAVMLSRYLAIAGLPDWISATVVQWELSPLALMLLTSVIYLVLGCLLDPIGLMLLTMPIILPLYKALGYDLIWLGIIVVKFIEIGLMTPPIGLNVYAAKTLVKDVSLSQIFTGVAWFLLAEVVVMILLFGFPQISLWLPNQLL